jgi:hypothetical protein
MLDALYARNAHACVWLVKCMTDSKEVLSQLLLEHTNFEVRETFAQLLKTAINVTTSNEESYLSETVSCIKKDVEGDQSVEQVPSAAIIRFMKIFFGELFDGKVRENWRRYEEYFAVLKDFSQLNFQASKIILEQHGIIRLIEFLMNHKPPFDSDKKPKMGEGKLVEPALTQPLDLVSFLIRCTFTHGIAA